MVDASLIQRKLKANTEWAINYWKCLYVLCLKKIDYVALVLLISLLLWIETTQSGLTVAASLDPRFEEFHISPFFVI